jgi:hypothetical protein
MEMLLLELPVSYAQAGQAGMGQEYLQLTRNGETVNVLKRNQEEMNCSRISFTSPTPGIGFTTILRAAPDPLAFYRRRTS